MDDSAMTFSHEVGHNFGAIHDDDTPDSFWDCRNQKYIMSSTGSDPQNLKFSRCSLINMTRQLDEVSLKIRKYAKREECKYNNKK